jgi:hypothetical protein
MECLSIMVVAMLRGRRINLHAAHRIGCHVCYHGDRGTVVMVMVDLVVRHGGNPAFSVRGR